MVKRNEQGEIEKTNLIHWSTCAVLLAFCIKKAKNNNQVNNTKEHKTTQETTIEKKKRHNITRPRDKLIKGLGVSLAKTPFKLITPKAGTLSQIFFYACCVVLLCYCLPYRAVKLLAVLLFVSFVLTFVCFCSFVVCTECDTKAFIGAEQWSITKTNYATKIQQIKEKITIIIVNQKKKSSYIVIKTSFSNIVDRMFKQYWFIPGSRKF